MTASIAATAVGRRFGSTVPETQVLSGDVTGTRSTTAQPFGHVAGPSFVSTVAGG